MSVRSGEAGAETKLTAEFAVVTVSLGVLQQGSLTFDPPLSAQQHEDAAAEEAEEPPEPTVGNPLQVLAEQNGLQLKVDRAVPQAYSNGWRGHAAWYVNGSKPPSMAKPDHPYTEGEWKGPEKVSTHRLATSPPIGTAGVASPIMTRSRCRSSSWTTRSIRRCSGRRASKPNLILPLSLRSAAQTYTLVSHWQAQQPGGRRPSQRWQRAGAL